MRTLRRAVLPLVAIAAVIGIVAGIGIFAWTQSKSNVKRHLDLQASENQFITAIHVAEEMRLFFTKTTDYLLQLAILDVSSRGGLSKATPPPAGAHVSKGVLYWRWCANPEPPTSCNPTDNAAGYCGPTYVDFTKLPELIRGQLNQSISNYTASYLNLFAESQKKNLVEISFSKENLTLNGEVSFSADLTTVVYTQPQRPTISSSFSTFGVVNSTDTEVALQKVNFTSAIFAIRKIVENPDSGTYFRNCTVVKTEFTPHGHINPSNPAVAIRIVKFINEHIPTCQQAVAATGATFGLSAILAVPACEAVLDDIDYFVETEADCAADALPGSHPIVKDYDCIVKATVPASTLQYTLGNEIAGKQHAMAFGLRYRGQWGNLYNSRCDLPSLSKCIMDAVTAFAPFLSLFSSPPDFGTIGTWTAATETVPPESQGTFDEAATAGSVPPEELNFEGTTQPPNPRVVIVGGGCRYCGAMKTKVAESSLLNSLDANQKTCLFSSQVCCLLPCTASLLPVPFYGQFDPSEVPCPGAASWGCALTSVKMAVEFCKGSTSSAFDSKMCTYPDADKNIDMISVLRSNGCSASSAGTLSFNQLVNELTVNGNPVIAKVDSTDPAFVAERGRAGGGSHYVVAVGYDPTNQWVIVNDPGTRYGEHLVVSKRAFEHSWAAFGQISRTVKT